MMRLVLLVVISLTLCGCADNFLVVQIGADWVPSELSWRREPDRAPKGLERLVAWVGRNGHPFENKHRVVSLVSTVGDESLITVAEKDPNIDDSDLYAPRPVRRYILKSGKLLASMGPLMEPFPDVDFERAVIRAAMQARVSQGFSVLIVDGWKERLSIKGQAVNQCLVEVTGREGYDPRGPELFRKTVNTCPPK